MIRVKICGLTSPEDVRAAVDAGADALGFNFWSGSARVVSPDRARELVEAAGPFTTRVGVFVDERAEVIRSIVEEVGLDAVQLHGAHDAGLAGLLPRRVIVAVRPRTTDDVEQLAAHAPPCAALLVDAAVPGRLGGTGQLASWELARQLRAVAPVVLAGGLTPGNVAAAVAAVQPYGVDVASGVERAPGLKDAAAMRAFVRAARSAAAEVGKGRDETS